VTDIQYKPGRTNQVADAFSIINTDGTDKKELDLELPCLSVEISQVFSTSVAVRKAGPAVAEVSLEPLRVSEFRSAQEDDELCRVLLEKNLIAEDYRELLCRVSPLGGSVQIVVPSCHQERCTRLFHLPIISGYTGSNTLYGQMRKLFYWPCVAGDNSRYVASCPSFVKKFPRNSRKTTRMKLFPLSSPMEFIAMDILGPLTTTER
jgi:hypothetical protein